MDLLLIGEEAAGFFHRHVQHFRDVLSLITDFQRLPVITASAADLAGDIDIREEVHLDAHQSVTGTGFAPAALRVEGKPPLVVAAHSRVLRGGV